MKHNGIAALRSAMHTPHPSPKSPNQQSPPCNTSDEFTGEVGRTDTNQDNPPRSVDASSDAPCIPPLKDAGSSCLEEKTDGAGDLQSLATLDEDFSLDNAQPLDPATFPNPPRQGSNQLPATIRNVEHLLGEYRILARYNVIKKKVMIVLPSHSGTAENADNVTMTHILSLAALNGLSGGRVPEYVDALADKNQYNPVANWICSRAWDGEDRLPAICDTVVEREGYAPHLKKILIYKWLLSTVAAAFKPSGFKGRGVLTFQGPQGIGKTSWVKSLVTDEVLQETTVKVDHHLDGSNKDSILGAVSHWIVEIGELDSSFKKDIARLKGFLTADFDKIRRPYARTESEYPRRTVFFASVNKADFLIDGTGNTRWWTIPVTKINFKHGIDMQQLFAQLAVDFKNGKEWWLNEHEEALLESCNSEHRAVSVIHELLMAKVDLGLKGSPNNPTMTATEVLKILGYEKPSNAQAKECAGILREILGEHKKINGINKWRIPLRRTGRAPIHSIDDY